MSKNSSQGKNRIAEDLANLDWSKNLLAVGKSFIDVFRELWIGIINNTVPWIHCMMWGNVLMAVIIADLDIRLLKMAGLEFLYPTSAFVFKIYFLTAALSAFLMWAIFQVGLKRRLLTRLTNIFSSTGLKNSLGKFPRFIFDKPLDSNTRMLRLTCANLPKAKFLAAKDALEASLQIYIDEIRDSISRGTIDIIYAHEKMPEIVKLESATLGKDQYVIGATRSGEVRASLDDVPHLLVAGQTGGGKSTYLRQLITSLYLSNEDYQFTLVDLKGGLEFQLFDKLPRVSVLSDIHLTVRELSFFESELDNRYEILKGLGCKDWEAYQKLPDNKKASRQKLLRHVIVIDEIAELFLAGSTMPPKEAQAVRRACSKVARQGRAVGVHLVACTQRPDSRALDTQIKGQLMGKVYFQMGDITSSMVVLSNKRARDLPAIPGRAIWQNGVKQVEVQVPFLSVVDAEQLLKPFAVTTKSKSAQKSANGEVQESSVNEQVPESKVIL